MGHPNQSILRGYLCTKGEYSGSTKDTGKPIRQKLSYTTANLRRGKKVEKQGKRGFIGKKSNNTLEVGGISTLANGVAEIVVVDMMWAV